MPDSPVNKYTLKEWIRHPTTIMLIIAVNVIWILISIVISTSKNAGENQVKDLIEQVVYLRERVDKLENQVDEYTTAILFKDGQIKVRDNVIDSLRRKETQGGLQ